jgi:membrane-bound lytic murein transglycosylase D
VRYSNENSFLLPIENNRILHNGESQMRRFLTLSLSALSLLAGCTDTQQALRGTAPRPILVDEYSVLDDTQKGKPMSDQALLRRLEEARRHYLLAMRSSERGLSSDAANHFEAAMTILNDLITYPNIDSNPEFTKLSESVIRDYEEQITSLDEMDPNSSFFVLRDKIFQEVETIPVAGRYNGRGALADASEFQIELSDNTPVQQCIEFFTSERGRKFFGKWLERTGRYFPMFDRVLAEEGAPQELRFLSMIESGLSPGAVSWAKAVGLWQFIPSTGQMYGLSINWWVDERRDPEKATRAAARYLRDLYNDLGDWHLALASYNCGPARVKSAINKAGSRDYWKVRQYLPRETQQYVPLYIAAAKITLNPEAYGFTSINYEEPLEHDVIDIKGSYDFAAISETSGIPVEELEKLNPHLLRDRIPADVSSYKLNVPHNAPRDLAARLEQLPPSERTLTTFVSHKVKRGESVASIARQYSVESGAILAANDMSSRSKLRSGMTLRIPVGANAKDAANTELASTETPSSATQGGPTMAAVPVESAQPTFEQRPVAPAPAPAVERRSEASREDTKLAATTRRESDAPTTPRTSPSTRFHRVASGETLIGIAREHGVSVADLAEWNGMERTGNVKIGQRLRLFEDGKLAARDRAKNDTKSSRLAARDDEGASSKRRRPTTTTSRFETYQVRKGESLTAIADRYGISVDDLRAWNDKTTSGRHLAAGTKLKIYSESSSKGDARRSSRNSKSAPKTYKVRKGDSLEEIAGRFGVSVSELRKNNPSLGRKGSKLRAGQSIAIKK